MSLDAVVFDFDGLIIDSEWVIFETACAAFEAHGHVLTPDAWSTVIGTNSSSDDGWWERVCAATGAVGFDEVAFEAAYEAQDRSNRDHLPALPGVLELATALRDEGIPIGIASSSSRSWLDRHVTRLGLGDHFTTLVGADLVGGVGKPRPDVYLRACADLGADPERAVALEDSTHGVAAAKAAGMAAVAVPSVLTQGHDFTAADLVVASLLELTVDRLASLVRDR